MAACSSDKPSPQHSFSELTGKTTTIKLDNTFVAGLSALGVAPTPIGKAKIAIPTSPSRSPAGTSTSTSRVTRRRRCRARSTTSGSGIQLTIGKGKKQKDIELKHLIIDPGKSLGGVVYANGSRIGGTVAQPAELFVLDASKMPAPTVDANGVATLTGIKVKLSSDAAAALNIALGLKGKQAGARRLAGGRRDDRGARARARLSWANATAAAVATFSESTPGAIGIRTRSCARGQRRIAQPGALGAEQHRPPLAAARRRAGRSARPGSARSW